MTFQNIEHPQKKGLLQLVAPGRPWAAPGHPTVFLWVGGNPWDVFPVSDGCGATLGTFCDTYTTSRMTWEAVRVSSGPGAEIRKMPKILENEQILNFLKSVSMMFLNTLRVCTGQETTPLASHRPGEPSSGASCIDVVGAYRVTKSEKYKKSSEMTKKILFTKVIL